MPLPFAPERSPAVLVPVLAPQPAEVLAQAAALAALSAGERPDVVEWRADHLYALDALGAAEIARALSGALLPLPLLVTLRSSEEGGAAGARSPESTRILTALASTAGVAAVDVEFAYGATVVADVRASARETGAAVMASAHDFEGTPPVDAMVDHLLAMQATGADVVKLAVTPHSRRDAAALLEATAEFAAQQRTPVITMAMGPTGLATRLTGHLFGSAGTFASAGQASAPGQPELARLRAALRSIRAAE